MLFNWLGLQTAQKPVSVPLPGNSVVFDLETTGLDPKQAVVVEGAVFDMKTGQPHRWAIEPHLAGKPVTREQLLDTAEPWFKDRFATQFDWVGKDPTQVSPESFVKQLAPHLKDKTLWIQNAPFESRMMNEVLKHHASQRDVNGLRSLMETRPGSPNSWNKIFFVTGRDVQAARSKAFETGDWMPVFEEYLKSSQVKTGATQVRDIQDVTRAIFSESARLDLFQGVQSFMGKGINTLSLAYGMPAEEHRAASDTKRESELLTKLWRNATGLYNARNRGIWGEIAYLFNDAYSEDLTAMKRVGAVRETLTSRSMIRNLAEARLAMEFNHNPEFAITDHHESVMMPIEDYEGHTVNQRINFPVKNRPKDYEEAVRILTSDRFIGKGMTHLVEEATNKVKTASVSQLRDMVHVPFSLEHQENEELMSIMSKAGKFTNWDAGRVLLARHPIKIAGVALSGLYLAGNAIDHATMRTSKSSTQGDALVDWSGLEPYGIGADMRRYSTDFGSGWKGLLNFIGKQPVKRAISTGWMNSGEISALGVDISERAARVIRKMDVGDWHTASSMIRKDSLSYPRDVNIFERLDGIADPRMQSPMATHMVGAHPGQLVSNTHTGYIGARDYNVIQGLGFGPKTKYGEFGSPWKGLMSVVRRVVGEKPLQEMAPMVFKPTEKVWGVIMGPQFADKGGVAIKATKALQILEKRHAWALEQGVTRFQLSSMRRTFQSAAKQGTGYVGFVKPYKNIDEVFASVRHERTHTHMPQELRDQLGRLSNSVVSRFGLPEKSSRYSRPDQLMEEMLAYDAQGIKFKGKYAQIRKEYAPLFDYAHEVVLKHASTVGGLQDKGFAKFLRKRDTDFGSPWKGLSRLMGRIGKTLEQMGRAKPRVDAELEKRIVGLLNTSGITSSDETVRAMIKDSKWVTMGDSRWLKLEMLGEGGFGKAELVVSGAGDKLAVLKTVKRGGAAAPRQALPFYYGGVYGGPASSTMKEAIRSSESGYKAYATKLKESLPEAERGAFEAQEFFTKRFRETQTHMPEEAYAAVSVEARLQEKAFKEATERAERAAFDDDFIGMGSAPIVPELFSHGMINEELNLFGKIMKSVGIGQKNQFGFVAEYGGIELTKAVKQGLLPPSRLTEIEGQVRSYVHSTLEEGGVFNWDISGANIVVHPKTGAVKIIDFGAATTIPPSLGREEVKYAKEYGDLVMNRIFGKMRGPKAVQQEVRIAQDQALVVEKTAKQVGAAEKTGQLIDEMNKRQMTAKIKANRQKHLMADAQKSVSMKMFTKPIGHTKGGG